LNPEIFNFCVLRLPADGWADVVSIFAINTARSWGARLGKGIEHGTSLISKSIVLDSLLSDKNQFGQNHLLNSVISLIGP
jgi:hypothetical protein